MRDYRFYIEKAKEKQGFKYDNQVDQALGFKGSMTTLITQGKRHSRNEKTPAKRGFLFGTLVLAKLTSCPSRA